MARDQPSVETLGYYQMSLRDEHKLAGFEFPNGIMIQRRARGGFRKGRKGHFSARLRENLRVLRVEIDLKFPALVITRAERMISPVNAKIVLPLILLAVFALSRWPGLTSDQGKIGLQNFSAAYAIAFCAGVYLPKRLAWWIPLVALLATDLCINLFFYHVSAFHISMVGNYLAFAAIIWLGTKFGRRDSWFKLLGGGVLGAIVFYLVTNTAAWLQLPEYPKTLAGLLQALTIGTPGWPHTWEFFRNTLLSGGLFAGLFAGAMKLEEKVAPEEEKSPAPETEEEPESASS